jgi:hypothetical protein
MNGEQTPTDVPTTETELATHLINEQYKLRKELDRKRTLWEWIVSIRERGRLRREIEKLTPAIMNAIGRRFGIWR